MNKPARIFLLMGALAFPFAAHATPAEQANFMVRLFSQVCVHHMGKKVEEVGHWLQELGLKRESADIEKKILQKNEGMVWASSNKMGAFHIVLVKPGQCAIWTAKADVEKVRANFSLIVEGMNTPGVQVEKIVDQLASGSSGDYYQLGYMVKREGAGGFAFLASTNPMDPEIQAKLTVTPVAEENLE